MLIQSQDGWSGRVSLWSRDAHCKELLKAVITLIYLLSPFFPLHFVSSGICSSANWLFYFCWSRLICASVLWKFLCGYFLFYRWERHINISERNGHGTGGKKRSFRNETEGKDWRIKTTLFSWSCKPMSFIVFTILFIVFTCLSVWPT